MTDLFPETVVKKSRRVIAHCVDLGVSNLKGFATVAKFVCGKCGWGSGWVHQTERMAWKRGVPCEKCNEKGPEDGFDG